MCRDEAVNACPRPCRPESQSQDNYTCVWIVVKLKVWGRERGSAPTGVPEVRDWRRARGLTSRGGAGAGGGARREKGGGLALFLDLILDHVEDEDRALPHSPDGQAVAAAHLLHGGAHPVSLPPEGRLDPRLPPLGPRGP